MVEVTFFPKNIRIYIDSCRNFVMAPTINEIFHVFIERVLGSNKEIYSVEIKNSSEITESTEKLLNKIINCGMFESITFKGNNTIEIEFSENALPGEITLFIKWLINVIRYEISSPEEYKKLTKESIEEWEESDYNIDESMTFNLFQEEDTIKQRVFMWGVEYLIMKKFMGGKRSIREIFERNYLGSYVWYYGIPSVISSEAGKELEDFILLHVKEEEVSEEVLSLIEYYTKKEEW